MKRTKLLLLQAGALPFCISANIVLRSVFGRFDSFVFSFFAYWLYLSAASFLLLRKNPELRARLASLFGKADSLFFAALAFLPAAMVFSVAFLPELASLTPRIFIAALLIGLFNGFIEEFFWRGISIAAAAGSKPRLAASVLLFGVFHAAFLFLDLEYSGGAANLIGGAFFLGTVWLLVSLKTKSVRASIAAHQLVNALAFSGLFILNGI